MEKELSGKRLFSIDRSTPLPSESPPGGTIAFVALLALLWGGNSVGLKVGLESLPPITLSTLRFALGWVLIGGWAILRGHRLSIQPSQVGWIAALSALFTVQTIALTVGTHHTSAAHSSIIMSAFPFFTALFAHFLVAGDRLTLPVLIGIAFAFAGVLVTFIGRDISTGATTLGDIVLLGSSIGLALRTVAAKRMSGRIGAVPLLFWMITLSLPPYAMLALIFEEPFANPMTVRAAVALGYVGLVVAGFCFLSWFALLHHYSPSKLSVLFFLQPLAGLAGSRLLVGEPIGVALIVGGVMVAVGIAVVDWPVRKFLSRPQKSIATSSADRR